jgi:transketolase C-terminal domain/subunit
MVTKEGIFQKHETINKNNVTIGKFKWAIGETNNVLNAIIDIDNVTLFTILTIPFINQPLELIENIKYTKKLIVVEEHSERGGLGEFLLMYLMKNEIYLYLNIYYI